VVRRLEDGVLVVAPGQQAGRERTRRARRRGRERRRQELLQRLLPERVEMIWTLATFGRLTAARPSSTVSTLTP